MSLPPEQFGRPKAAAGTWASCIRIISPLEVRLLVVSVKPPSAHITQSETVNVIHLDNNEAAFSIAIVPFAAKNNELHLVVGTAQDTFLAPRSCTSGFIRTYRFTDDGRSLELLHKVCVSYTCSGASTNQMSRPRRTMSRSP